MSDSRDEYNTIAFSIFASLRRSRYHTFFGLRLEARELYAVFRVLYHSLVYLKYLARASYTCGFWEVCDFQSVSCVQARLSKNELEKKCISHRKEATTATQYKPCQQNPHQNPHHKPPPGKGDRYHSS